MKKLTIVEWMNMAWCVLIVSILVIFTVNFFGVMPVAIGMLTIACAVMAWMIVRKNKEIAVLTGDVEHHKGAKLFYEAMYRGSININAGHALNTQGTMPISVAYEPPKERDHPNYGEPQL